MIPVGDFLRRRSTPYVNWTLLAVNIAVFVYMLTLDSTTVLRHGQPIERIGNFMYDWGFVSACVADQLGYQTNVSARELQVVCNEGNRAVLQVFTAMFVHAGWAHILGNMLFLWIFGDNVEDHFGHLRYLVFYFLAGIVAAAAQIAVSPDTVVPNVGASGAIAGVLGAYLVMFPRAMVQVVFIFFPFLPFFVPAIVLIGMWFVTQVFSGLGELGDATTGSGVAWWAHIGGFAAGVVLVWFFRKRQRRALYTA